MSLDNTNIIDAIGIDNATGNAVLTIADDWDWSDDRNHLVALQSKINMYLEFIESGQFCDEYPAASGRQFVIDVVSRYPIPEAATKFLQSAAATALEIDILITQRNYGGDQR